MNRYTVESYKDLERIAKKWRGKVCLFGGGVIGRTWGYDMIVTAGFKIDFYCDNHIAAGSEINGKRCVAIDELLQYGDQVLVFITTGGAYQEEIQRQLLQGGIKNIIRINRMLQKSSFLEKVLPYTYYKYIQILYTGITSKDKSKLYRSAYFYKFRPFSKKKYCIIRYHRPAYSVFAAARAYIIAAEYAKSKGMQPLIDIEWLDDFDKGILDKENGWDLGFAQEKIQDVLKENATILVSEVSASGMCLKETCLDINNNPMDHNIHVTDVNWRDYYRNVYKYAEKYWKFNKDVLFKVNEKIEEFFGGGQSVLGVSLRELFSEELNSRFEGTDVGEVLRRHPLGPDVSEILDIVAQYMSKWNCDKIFITTMFEDSIKIFEDRFPGRVIYTDRFRDTHEEYIMRRKSVGFKCKPQDVEWLYKHEKGYIQEMILLAKCTYLIGAKGGGTSAALVMNNGQYKDVKILEDKRNIERY